MTRSLIMNLIVAVIWLFLSGKPSLRVFLVGLALGFLLLWMFRGVLGSDAFVRRTFALVRFILIFLKEFALSNIAMARAVMFRDREGIHPNFITFDTRDMTPFEILLLSHCVTLTPGTTTVDIEKDYSRMVIHAFDADDPDAVREGITRKLKANILAWTRKEEA